MRLFLIVSLLSIIPFSLEARDLEETAIELELTKSSTTQQLNDKSIFLEAEPTQVPQVVRIENSAAKIKSNTVFTVVAVPSIMFLLGGVCWGIARDNFAGAPAGFVVVGVTGVLGGILARQLTYMMWSK